MTNRTFDVPVNGGSLRVGRWGEGERVVVGLHGVTGTHADFHAVGDQLGDDVTLVGLDLRGRGGSGQLPGPYGMVAHADDVAAVINHVGGAPVTLVGHSMGGFVSLVTAHRHPDLVRNLVLVDGGLPLALGALADGPVEEVVQALLGPSLERLRMTFPSPEAYLDFWRPHPAFADDWNEYVEGRILYDLVGEAPNLRSSVNEEAVVHDTKSDLFGDDVEKALVELRHPAVFLRAPRGQFNQEPPLYPESVVDEWCAKLPLLESVFVPDVNHFSIMLAERGAAAVAEAIRASGAGPR
jgi:lipase